MHVSTSSGNMRSRVSLVVLVLKTVKRQYSNKCQQPWNLNGEESRVFHDPGNSAITGIGIRKYYPRCKQDIRQYIQPSSCNFMPWDIAIHPRYQQILCGDVHLGISLSKAPSGHCHPQAGGAAPQI